MSKLKAACRAHIFQVTCNQQVGNSVQAEVARTGETTAGYFKRLHRENIERLAHDKDNTMGIPFPVL